MFPAVLFIAVGFITALSVGFRLVHDRSLGRRAAPAGRLRSMPVHLLVVVLLAVAFVADHRSVAGWVALLGALFVELVRWGVGGVSTSAASDGVTGTPGDQSSPAEEPGRTEALSRPNMETKTPAESSRGAPLGESASSDLTWTEDIVESSGGADDPAPSAKTEIQVEPATASDDLTFRTLVLLRSDWQPVPAVVRASLRRAGQRDALTAEPLPTGDGLLIRAGPIALHLRPSTMLFEWRETDVELARDGGSTAEAAMPEHAAHLSLESTFDRSVAPADVLRLHRRAHAALTDFAPVVGAIWPAAGLLTPVEGLVDAADDSIPPVESCIRIRTSRAATDDGWVHCDTLGLAPFELPDIQMTARCDAAEEATRVVRRIVEALLECGGRDRIGSVFRLDDGTEWDAQVVDAAQLPKRVVLEITPSEGV